MRRWLARRERLGLTLRELSAETGVPVGTLGHWAWKLRQEGEGRGAAVSGAGFVELVASEGDAADGRIEIELAGDRRVTVIGAVDEAALTRVMRAVQRC
jgi:hypothetical protein